MKQTRDRGSDTRARMIRSAYELFHRQGIRATTVDQVLERSDTGKSQFYHYFKNKEGLIHAVLVEFYKRMYSEKSPLKSRMESWADLKDWFGFFVNYQKEHGCDRSCAIGTIGSDLAGNDELLRQDVRLIFERMKQPLSDFFHTMKGKGELPESADPSALADFCVSIMQGGLLVAKIKREVRPFEHSVTHALQYLRSLNQAL